jgi:Holliday junction resolvasome RuvABC endonuclease subunit
VKILALDPGAKRMGWAILSQDSGGPVYWNSGVAGVERTVETYHTYRLLLIDHFQYWARSMIDDHQPDVVVSELLPVKGFRDMSQALLAGTAITTVQAVAINKVVVAQVAVQRIKVAIGRSVRASKVKVREGVIQLLPELEPHRKNWTKVFDEPDAIAVGLTYLGCENT